MIVEGRITIASTSRDLFEILTNPAARAALDASLVEVGPLSRAAPGTTGCDLDGRLSKLKSHLETGLVAS